jgi:hypothetical protein
VARAEQSPPTVERDSPTWLRLEEQIRWYDEHSAANQRRYKLCKYTEILAAAAIPAAAAIGTAAWVAAVLGALILLLEGIQHLNQYQQNWITYRSTAEALKHEKYLYLAGAAQYSGDESLQRLAIRIEGLVSQEHAAWVSTQQEPGHTGQGG